MIVHRDHQSNGGCRLHKIGLRVARRVIYTGDAMFARARLILPRPKLLPDVTTHRAVDVQARLGNTFAAMYIIRRSLV